MLNASLPKFRTLSDVELVHRVSQTWSRAITVNEQNFARSAENLRFYVGVDADRGHGQWPMDAVTDMTLEGRHIATYNFCQPIVDSIAGGILKSPFKTNFSPVVGQVTSLTQTLATLYQIDRDLCDWQIAFMDAIIHMLIHRADAEMYCNYEYDKKFGNIGMRIRLPGTVVYDPFWLTRRSKDCKKCWVSSWLTPLQMLDVFPDTAEDISIAAFFKKNGRNATNWQALAEQEHQHGPTYGDARGPVPRSHQDDVWGSQFRVISEYEMRQSKVKREYVQGLPRPENPQGVYEIPLELADAQAKIEWMNQNIPEWQPDGVFEEESWEDVQIMTAISPTFSPTLILDRKPTKVQCGRLQFFPLSASRVNGVDKGIIDNIKDTQMQINYWESLLTHKIQIEGGGGSQFVDPKGFKNPAEMEKYKRARNNPGENFETIPGYLEKNPNGPAAPTRKSVFPGEVTNHLQHLIDVILTRISKATPASQGISESSSESGYLYRLKKMQTDIQQFTIYESVRHWWNEWGEAYMTQAAHQYGNGIQRQFYDPRTRETIVINEMQERNGAIVMVNNFAALKTERHKVQVTESEDAPTRKVELMITAGEAIKSMPQTKTLTIAKLGSVLARSIDAFSDEDNAELERFDEMELRVAEQEMNARYANMQYAELAAKRQAQQLAMAMAQEAQAAQMGGAMQPQGALPTPTGESGQPPQIPDSKPMGTTSPAAKQAMGGRSMVAETFAANAA